ncbi:MAG: efflux RND transporter periplasmic adaptor subunit [Candidatus Latescibacterota bacterium]
MPDPRPRRRRKRSRILKLLVGLAVVAAVAVTAYLNLKKEKPAETFETVAVGRGPLVDKLAETGSIELVRTVEVKSTISGKVHQLLVEAGDAVERGQLLAVIEPDPNESLQLQQQRMAVERGRIDLAEQERDFARKESLHASRMLPEKEYEEAQTQLVRARNALRLAEMGLEILETKVNLGVAGETSTTGELGEVRVLAPIAGVVIHREVEIGEVVASGLSAFSGGTLLFEIGDPSQMIVRGDIAEIDVAKLAVGQAVDIVVDAYPDTTYHGRVRWIAPVGQRKQGSTIVTFDVEIQVLDLEPRLRQGMSCDIDVIFARRDTTLYLPVEAALQVFDDQGGQRKERQVKGKRGRFVAYVVRDTAAASPDSAAAADTVAALGTAAVGAAAADTVVRDSAAADTAVTDSATAATADSARADSAHADSAQSKEPPRARLDEFVETELVIGLETTTQVEVLAGLQPGQRVAIDPKVIRTKLEEKSKAPPPKKGWF